MRNYLAIFFLITGCATTPEPLVPIAYQFRDNPIERRVELTYQNRSRDSMCLLPENWPNLAGKINQASDIVHLIINHERFAVEDFNTGYCPKGCVTRANPGEKLEAFISYKDFNLPDRLINEPKILEFASVAFKCSRFD
jgi:hypothetical protein